TQTKSNVSKSKWDDDDDGDETTTDSTKQNQIQSEP
ncbi:unnamed protein product, partial [Rotaria magnacalcarata]